MRKSLLILLCLLLFCGVVAGTLVWLHRSPRGVYNDAGADATVQKLLESTAQEEWAALLRPLWPQEVTDFEDRDALFDRLFALAADGQDFSFREYSGTAEALAGTYILSAGETDLALLRLAWEEGGWRVRSWEMPEGMLTAEARTLSLTVPEGSAVKVNGVELGAEYLAEENLPYEDLTALERRFARVPHAVRYELPGILGDVTVEVPGQVLLYADGTVWRFAPPDAAAWSFRVLAPEEAEVTVCGAVLTAEDCAARETMIPDVTVPEEYAALLPGVCLYEAAGLYTRPEIAVTLNGAALTGREEEGTLVFPRPGDEAAEAELRTLAEDFLTAYCRYGAHHFGYAGVTRYVVPESELYHFLVNSQPSLIWINGETVDFHSVTSGDYLCLGDDCRICSAHVSCTTVTYYETQELEMDYQLLFLRTEDGWRVGDMAYQ